jgi:hypothetical protein
MGLEEFLEGVVLGIEVVYVVEVRDGVGVGMFVDTVKELKKIMFASDER